MLAFYFAHEDRKLRYGDGRDIVIGETHKHEGAVSLCESGLHAARTPFEALQHAPGPILYLVRLSGVIVEGYDKAAASERTYLAEFDATELCRLFARKQAMEHVELLRPFCSEDEYAAITAYLTTGEERHRVAAEAAAWTAGWAAEAAERAAERAAAWAAARAAARGAWAAARVAWAARAAAWAAEAAVRTAAGAAVRTAAGAAVRTAAWAESAARFNALVKEATGWEF